MNENGDLSSKTAIVTGGSRGIGRSIVVELVRAGCTVVFTYVNQVEAAEQTLALLNGNSHRARAIKADVRIQEEARKVIEFTRESFSGCSILVNNAGITRDGALSLMKNDEWTDVVDTNLTGCFHYVHAVTP